MNFGLFEEQLLLNKAVIFDLAGICSLAGAIMFIFNLSLERRWLARCSFGLFASGAFVGAGLWLFELHHDQLALENRRISPYFLSGYYSGH